MRLGVLSSPSALAVLVAAGSLMGCLSSRNAPAGQASSGPSSLWINDAHALREAIALPNVIAVALVLATLWLGGRLARAALRVGWRLGLDPTRRLASWLGIAQLATAAAALAVAVAWILDVAPTFGLAMLALALGASVVVMGRSLQSLWAGLLMRTRLRLREGDRITLQGHSGIVRHIGLLRIEVLSSEGASVFLPNHLVAQDALSVEQERRAAKVRVRVRLEPDASGDVGERMRRAAVLSPYRAPQTPVGVAIDEDRAGAWIEMHVWYTGAAAVAERQLAAALAVAARAPEPVRPRGTDKDTRGEHSPAS